MEKTQVLVILGGTSFTHDADFYEFLENYNIDFSYESGKDWKANLQEDLGENFEVIRPTMPNKMRADYHAWKIWFEKYVGHLSSEKIILIGHSLGGIFLAKYLSENNMLDELKKSSLPHHSSHDVPQEIYGLYLVAAVFDHGVDKALGNFRLDLEKLSNVSKQCSQIYLYHSKDDPVVPFNHSREYLSRLEGSELIALEHKGHINQEHFEELVERIRNSN